MSWPKCHYCGIEMTHGYSCLDVETCLRRQRDQVVDKVALLQSALTKWRVTQPNNVSADQRLIEACNKVFGKDGW